MADRNPILPPASDAAVQFNQDALAQKDQEAEVAVEEAQSTAASAFNQSTINNTNITNIINGTQTIAPTSHFHSDYINPKLPAGKFIGNIIPVNATNFDFTRTAARLHRIYFGLFILPNGGTIDQMAVTQNGLGTATPARLGIYDEVEGRPDTLLVDAGTVTVGTSAVGTDLTLNLASPLVLSPGRYYTAFVYQTTVTGSAGVYGFATAANVADNAPFMYQGTIGKITGRGAPAGVFSTIGNTYTGALPSNTTNGTILEETSTNGPIVALRGA